MSAPAAAAASKEVHDDELLVDYEEEAGAAGLEPEKKTAKAKEVTR